MILPSGKSKNSVRLDTEDQTRNPSSPDYVPELKKNMKTAKVKDRSWAKQNTDNIMMKQNVMNKASSIGSARAGNLTDIGGPVKQLRISSSNSIWDSNVLDEMKNKKDSGERIREQNEKTAAKRDKERQESRNLSIDKDALKEILANGSTTRGNSVTKTNANDSYNYNSHVPKNELSIFGDRDFKQIPEKTDGENFKVAKSERAAKHKQDRSWAKANTPSSTKNRVQKFFNKKNGK